MATKRKGLGRGLEALLSSSQPAEPSAPQTPSATDTAELPIEAMKRGRYQPRDDMRQDSLDELAESIRAQGLIQPIVVRPLANVATGEPTHEIIAGERRWRAAQRAGLADVPVVVRDVDDEAAMAMALIENIQREDLNPLEEALALKRLIAEFDLTHEEAARAVGRSRAAVTNLTRLTELTPDVQALLRERQIDMGHARALLGLDDPAEQIAIARRVAREKLSVRAVEALIKSAKTGKAKATQQQATKSADVRRLEQTLSERLGAPVDIDAGAKGQGKVTIRFHSLDELDGIVEHITQ
ncbi:MAG: ParB/RepB/Spo0J family partition protein [Pseudomonadota bacterium]